VPLVLASASPRRAELLRAAGFAFIVHPVDVDESPREGEPPEAYVTRLAAEKLDAARTAHPEAVIIAADTTVVLDGLVLGKPEDDEAAAAMLRQLSGRSHVVLTGVAVGSPGGTAVEMASTVVHFSHLTEKDLAWYVASGEPRDKAGAYGIQGLASRFVERIEGSYTNVVGLPVALVARLLDAAIGGIPAPPVPEQPAGLARF
jgi:septum formation protein